MPHEKASHQCLLCDKFIKSAAGVGSLRVQPLLGHMETHTDVFRYSCEQCGLSSDRQSKVFNHIKCVHHGQANCVDNRTEQEWTDLFNKARRAFPEVIDWLDEVELKRKAKRAKQEKMDLMQDSLHSNNMNTTEQTDEVANGSPDHSILENPMVSSSTEYVFNSTRGQNRLASPPVQVLPRLVIGQNSTIRENDVEDQANVPVENLASSRHQFSQPLSTSAQSFTFEESVREIKTFCLPSVELDDPEKRALCEKVRSLEAECNKWKAQHEKAIAELGACQVKKRFYKSEIQRLKEKISRSRDQEIIVLD